MGERVRACGARSATFARARSSDQQGLLDRHAAVWLDAGYIPVGAGHGVDRAALRHPDLETVVGR